MAGDPFGKFGNAQNKYVQRLAGWWAGSPTPGLHTPLEGSYPSAVQCSIAHRASGPSPACSQPGHCLRRVEEETSDLRGKACREGKQSWLWRARHRTHLPQVPER